MTQPYLKLTRMNNSVNLTNHPRTQKRMPCSKSRRLQSNAVEIVNIEVLKKGWTNRSFLFTCKGQKYIMRIPGEGTDYLINRKEEADVYRVLEGKQICDDVVYMNPDNGYKITAYLEGARSCDSTE